MAETGHDHVLPVSLYRRIFLLLMVLLVLTIAASFVHIPIPGANIVVAMAIALVKAYLVVMYFMNVKFSTRLTWLWAAAGFVWLLIMFLIFGDYLTRHWEAVQGWQ